MRRRRRLRRSGITVVMALSSVWVGRVDAQVPGVAAGAADTLTLAGALTVALERDPHLMAASAGADAAAAGRVQARAAWLPSLIGSGTVTRFQEPMVVAPLHRFDPNSPPDFDRTLAHPRPVPGRRADAPRLTPCRHPTRRGCLHPETPLGAP